MDRKCAASQRVNVDSDAIHQDELLDTVATPAPRYPPYLSGLKIAAPSGVWLGRARLLTRDSDTTNTRLTMAREAMIVHRRGRGSVTVDIWRAFGSPNLLDHLGVVVLVQEHWLQFTRSSCTESDRIFCSGFVLHSCSTTPCQATLYQQQQRRQLCVTCCEAHVERLCGLHVYV